MQRKLPLISSMQREPKAAQDVVLRQIKNEAHAVKVAMKSGNLKLLFIARSLGVSEGYISRIRSGKRRIPAWFVLPFCCITGTRQLKQFIDWQESLAAMQDAERDNTDWLADQLRRAA